MRVLITGITGFAGSHLADYLIAEHPDVEIFGTYRWRSRRENIEHLDGKVTLLETDLRDYPSVAAALRRAEPDAIFHLAAQSFVPTSWNAPSETIVTNVVGQTNIFEAGRALGLDPRIQIACSSEEYGLVLPDEVPIRETNPLRPLSPYAVSKVSQDYLGYQYFQSYGIKALRTRGFNHTGPRRGEVFVTSNFAKQIALIEAGRQAPVISVGNLDAVRDFTDVRDMVRAYWLAVQSARPGEVYNIATGNGITIRAMLDKLIALARVEVLIGDSSKFRGDTGWEPRIPFDQTLADLLDYWRARVAAPGAVASV